MFLSVLLIVCEKISDIENANKQTREKNEDEVIDIAEEISDVTDGGIVSLFEQMDSGNDKTYLEVIKAMKEEKESNNAMLQMMMTQHQQQMTEMMTLLTNHIFANGANSNTHNKRNEDSSDDTSK